LLCLEFIWKAQVLISLSFFSGKKTGKPVYVSFNVKEGDSKAISSFAVKRLLQELENKS